MNDNTRVFSCVNNKNITPPPASLQFKSGECEILKPSEGLVRPCDGFSVIFVGKETGV